MSADLVEARRIEPFLGHAARPQDASRPVLFQSPFDPWRGYAIHGLDGARITRQMLCQKRRELEQEKRDVDELLEKYAPGNREFEHWIAESEN